MFAYDADLDAFIAYLLIDGCRLLRDSKELFFYLFIYGRLELILEQRLWNRGQGGNTTLLSPTFANWYPPSAISYYRVLISIAPRGAAYSHGSTSYFLLNIVPLQTTLRGGLLLCLLTIILTTTRYLR